MLCGVWFTCLLYAGLSWLTVVLLFVWMDGCFVFCFLEDWLLDVGSFDFDVLCLRVWVLAYLIVLLGSSFYFCFDFVLFGLIVCVAIDVLV